MNKQQKKNLVRTRRFAQRINKITSRLFLVDIEMGGLNPEQTVEPTFTPNMELIRKLTLKELEAIIAMPLMTAEGYNQELYSTLTNEYAERKLLLEKRS